MLDKLFAGAAVSLVLVYVGLIISFLAGWVTNIVWLIQNGFGDWQAEVIISVVGIFLFPLGAIHGIYTWF